MRPRTGFGLLVAGIVVAGAGWYFGPGQLPSASGQVATGQLMFPDLAARLQDAAEVDIVHQGKTLVIRRDGNVWGLADRGGYPVETEKLRGVLTGLTELRLAEPRTSDPANYSRLGVEDPESKTGSADLVKVMDRSGKPIATLIVGHRRVLTRGNVPDEVYVRRPDEAQSWLAYGSLSVDADPQLWLARDIMNVDHGQIAQVTVDRDGAKLVLDGKDGKLTLTEPAQHGPLDNYKLDEVASALEQLTCDDVHPGPAPTSGAVGDSVFTTTDGLRVAVHLFHQDKNLLARFDVSGKGAEKLQQRIGGWTYQIGSWKESELAPTLADLEQKPPAKPATSGATE